MRGASFSACWQYLCATIVMGTWSGMSDYVGRKRLMTISAAGQVGRQPTGPVSMVGCRSLDDGSTLHPRSIREQSMGAWARQACSGAAAGGGGGVRWQVVTVFLTLVGLWSGTYKAAMGFIYLGCVVQGLTGSYGVFLMVTTHLPPSLPGPACLWSAERPRCWSRVVVNRRCTRTVRT